MINIIVTIFFSFFYYQSSNPSPKIEIIPVVKTARITCYNNYGITASGLITKKGIIATSDRIIPMKTKIYIEDYGEMLIADKTNKRIQKDYGLTFDIYDPDCDKDFGVKKLSYILLK